MRLPASTKLRVNSFREGFTLIEMMVVITVIGILASMVLYGLSRAQAAARDASRQQIMTGIQVALERYYGDFQAYHPVPFPGPGGGNDFCGLILTLITPPTNYLSALPVDPLTKTDLCTTGGNQCCSSSGCGASSQASCTSGAWYGYLSSGGSSPQSYTLTLKKESGGVNTFANPQ